MDVDMDVDDDNISTTATIGSNQHEHEHITTSTSTSSSSPRSAEAEAEAEASATADNKAQNDDEDEDEDKYLDNRIKSLGTELIRLNLEAQEQLYTQHRLSTQRALSRDTAELYSKYAQHGSMPRLASALWDFLSPRRGEEEEDDGYEQGQQGQQQGQQEEDGVMTDQNNNTANANPSQHSPPTNPNPDPDHNHNHNHKYNASSNPHTKRPRYATSPSTTAIIATLGFHPADMKITFPAHLDIPVAVLRSINNILLLQNSIAQAKLRHHVAKYCLPFPYPSSGQQTGRGEAHPHILPLFRLAISEPLQHRLSTMFVGQSIDTHPLGLTRDSVKFLRQAYDARSGAASDLEYMWLARALRVDEGVVREWWRQEDHAHRAKNMMVIWMAAREWERRTWYKERGML